MRYNFPEIRAAIALSRDRPAESVELLASASPYERSYLETIYLRGLAYLRLQKGAEAATEFRKIVDHKGANWASGWRHPYWGQFYSLSILGLARAFARVDDKEKARKAFQDFFELWKYADQDIPVLRQAQERNTTSCGESVTRLCKKIPFNPYNHLQAFFRQAHVPANLAR